MPSRWILEARQRQLYRSMMLNKHHYVWLWRGCACCKACGALITVYVCGDFDAADLDDEKLAHFARHLITAAGSTIRRVCALGPSPCDEEDFYDSRPKIYYAWDIPWGFSKLEPDDFDRFPNGNPELF